MVIRKCADGQHLPSLAWNVDGGKASVAATATATTTTTIREGSKQNMLAINSIWRAMCEACAAFVYCHLLILQPCKYARQWEQEYDDGQGRDAGAIVATATAVVDKAEPKSFACPTNYARDRPRRSQMKTALLNPIKEREREDSWHFSCFVSFPICFVSHSFHFTRFCSAFARQLLAQLLANSVAVRLRCIYS